MEENQQQPESTVDNQQPNQPAQEPHPVTRRERQHHKKLVLVGVGAAVAALLLAGAAYWFFLRDTSDKQSTQASTNDTSQSQQPAALPSADPTPTTFKSAKFNIELTHRKDWKLKESPDGEITITSPQTSITGADGQAEMSVFTLKVRKGVTDTMQATIEKLIASRNSEVIAYTAPTEEQRQYTNVSYLGKTKEVFNLFIVTGSTEFKVGNSAAYTLPLDSEFYLVAGGYGSGGNTLSFDPVPVASMDSEVLTQAMAIAESLKIY